MTTIEAPTYSLETLTNEYNKVHFRFKPKRELVTDSEIRSFIAQHPIVYTIIRGLTH